MLEALKSAPHLNDNYNKIGTVFKFLLHLRSSKFLCSLVSSIAHRRAPVLSPPFMSLLLFNVYGLHLIHKFLIMDRKQCPRCNAWYSLSRGLKIHMGYCSKIDVSKLKSTDNNSDSFQINQHPLLSNNTDLFWSNKHAHNNDVYSTDANSQGHNNHDKYSADAGNTDDDYISAFGSDLSTVDND